MSNVSPSSFLLPIFITLSVFGRNELSFEVTVRLTDTISDMRDLLVEQSAAKGNAIVEFSPISAFQLKRSRPRKQKPPLSSSPSFIDVLFGRKESHDENEQGPPPPQLLTDESLSIGNLSIENHCELILINGVRLSNETPICQSYDKDIQFFCCVECKEYHVCRSCAMHCHKDHTLVLMSKEDIKSSECHCSEVRGVNGDQPLSACRIRTKVNKNDEKKYEDEVKQLVSMGFENEETNLTYLRNNGGDVDKAVTSLLTASGTNGHVGTNKQIIRKQ